LQTTVSGASDIPLPRLTRIKDIDKEGGIIPLVIWKT
jgi:hypothetical protein